MAPPTNLLIPIYSAEDRRFLRYAPEEHLLAHESHFRIVRNRRGYIKRAYCRTSMSLDKRPASRLGMSFEQMLPSGPVWALGGVTGSK